MQVIMVSPQHFFKFLSSIIFLIIAGNKTYLIFIHLWYFTLLNGNKLYDDVLETK